MFYSSSFSFNALTNYINVELTYIFVCCIFWIRLHFRLQYTIVCMFLFFAPSSFSIVIVVIASKFSAFIVFSIVFNKFTFPSFRNFVSGSKRFLRSWMRTIDCITVCHYAFKFVHGSRFPGQSKDKVFVFKMFVDLPSSGVKLVKGI